MKRSFFHNLASFFAFFCIVFIPFPFYISQIQYEITDLIFGKLIGFIAGNVFNKPLPITRIYSDSVSMYILVLLLFILALIISLIVHRVKKWPQYRPAVVAFITTLCFYYLALQMLKYGLDKVFKNQFYLPEPNTLYTPLGRLDKDILYWSSMGTSHFYSVFMGLLETLAAIFLLIRRTRLIGLLMSIAILLNVIAVNFGFDIGVKLYSLFLFFLTAWLLVPYAQRLYRLLLARDAVTIEPVVDPPLFPVKNFFYYFLKWLVIGLIIVEASARFIRASNFNGDTAPRPYLHGAYEVKQMIRGDDTIKNEIPVKRFFIHSHDYLVFQDRSDNMRDYKIVPDGRSSGYVLMDYEKNKIPLSMRFNEKDSILSLTYGDPGKEIKLEGKAIDWKKLPALKKGFRWTADGK